MSELREAEQNLYKLAREEGQASVEAYIKQRQETSTAIYRQQRAATQARQAALKEGRAYLHENRERVTLYSGNIYKYVISVGCLLKTGEETNQAYYRVGYAICSPKDTFSVPIAKGLIGLRLRDTKSPYGFNILLNTGGTIKRDRLRAIIQNHLMMDFLSGRVDIPVKIAKAVCQEFGELQLAEGVV